MDLLDSQVYGIVGDGGFSRLVAAFYRKVPHDDILGPLYPRHDMAGAEIRLRLFLIMRFGGPQRYLEQRGHPRLRMRHAPITVDRRGRDRWVMLMGQALDEVGLPPDATAVLRRFFEDAATFLMNQPD